MLNKPSKQPIWCDHCNAGILPSGVRACLRSDCETKCLLEELED